MKNEVRLLGKKLNKLKKKDNNKGRKNPQKTITKHMKQNCDEEREAKKGSKVERRTERKKRKVII